MRPPIDAALKKMKEDGVEKIAAIGYCYGARPVTWRCQSIPSTTDLAIRIQAFDLGFEKKFAVIAG